MHSIRTTITAITIGVVLASILAVFAASYVIIQSETDRNSVSMMNLIDDDAQKSLEKYFESIEQSVETSANIAVKDLDSVFLVESGVVRTDDGASERTPDQQKALDTYLRKYCAKIQKDYAGVADYTHGVTAYYYCIDTAISENEHGFYYKKVGKTGFIEQDPLDVRNSEPSDVLGCSWYEAAVKAGRPVWIGPYICDPDDGTWICSYFVPIYKSGVLIGVMGMDIPCETLADQINSMSVYDSGYVCLLDPDGRVIYHPDLPIGSDINELGLSINSDLLHADNSGEELIRYKADGQDRQMSFSTLLNGMKLVSVAPAREINAPWIRLIKAIAMIAAVILILFAILIFFVMKVITYPLEQLTSASQRLADADYDVELDYHSDNEIGTLTSSFMRMRDQIRTYIDDLNHQIYHDRLTDLPNMRHFFDLAIKWRDSVVAKGQEPVMLYFNIIGLSNYNRQFGFDRGDQLIVGFSRILARRFGDHRVCRYNGANFAAVTDEAHVEEDLAAVLRDCETAMDGGRLPVRIGVYSNGIGVVDVNEACDRAKFAGDINKGELSTSITYFTEAMLKKGENYRYIVNNIDQALAEGWIKVYYQPIVRAANGRICDEEALARWIDPKLGFLSPADFIPALEESKLIYKLDLYIVDQVLDKLNRLKEKGLYQVPQSVNLSRMDFESCDIVEEICRRVDCAGIDRSMITIEITESVIGSDFDFMKGQIERFRKLGFPVWMDDFGSGYSALDVLQHIHFDLIKFDMKFMELFYEGDESKIILTEMMNMAISLGMETVCEGVEYAEQVEFLREIGCTRIQGYYYGKPLPYEDVMDRVENGGDLEYENPDEADYFASLGRINLYDISALSSENDDSLTHYFNTLPMCIMEVNGDKVKYTRCNRSYLDFLERTIGLDYTTDEIDINDKTEAIGAGFLRSVKQCAEEGSRFIIDERLSDDTVAHTLLRRITVNPVTGTAAVAVAVLAVVRKDKETKTV